jgi:YD repeat-containing protein
MPARPDRQSGCQRTAESATAGRLAGFVAGNGVEYGIDRTPAVHGAFIERVWAATSAWASPPDLLDLSYTPDALGRIDSVADGVDPDRSVDCGYDPRGRLTTAVSDAWSLSWTYDVAGNRLSETRDGAVLGFFAWIATRPRPRG